MSECVKNPTTDTVRSLLECAANTSSLSATARLSDSHWCRQTNLWELPLKNLRPGAEGGNVCSLHASSFPQSREGGLTQHAHFFVSDPVVLRVRVSEGEARSKAESLGGGRTFPTPTSHSAAQVERWPGHPEACHQRGTVDFLMYVSSDIFLCRRGHIFYYLLTQNGRTVHGVL